MKIIVNVYQRRRIFPVFFYYKYLCTTYLCIKISGGDITLPLSITDNLHGILPQPHIEKIMLYFTHCLAFT